MSSRSDTIQELQGLAVSNGSEVEVAGGSEAGPSSGSAMKKPSLCRRIRTYWKRCFAGLRNWFRSFDDDMQHGQGASCTWWGWRGWGERLAKGLFALVLGLALILPWFIWWWIGKAKQAIAVPAGRALWWLVRGSIGGDAQRDLQRLLRPQVKKQYILILNTVIIVSGLLTTSTYQAVYQSFVPAYYNTSDTNAYGSVSRLTNPELMGNMMVFRLANMMSFSASIVSIMCCAMLILWMNRYAPAIKEEAEEEPPVLEEWAAGLIYTTYLLATTSFYTSLVCAFFAAVLAAMGFFSGTWATFLAFAVVIASIAVTCVGAAMLSIADTPNRGLKQYKVHGQAHKAEPEGGRDEPKGVSSPMAKQGISDELLMEILMALRHMGHVAQQRLHPQEQQEIVAGIPNAPSMVDEPVALAAASQGVLAVQCGGMGA